MKELKRYLRQYIFDASENDFIFKQDLETIIEYAKEDFDNFDGSVIWEIVYNILEDNDITIFNGGA